MKYEKSRLLGHFIMKIFANNSTFFMIHIKPLGKPSIKKNCLNLELCQIRGGRGLPDPNFRKASEFGHPERGRGGLGQNSKLKFIILKG